MDVLETGWNKSTRNQYSIRVHQQGSIASEYHRQLFSTINYFILSGVFSIFGIVSNFINMIIFYKQGLNTTINISFFSMAFADLCGLLIQLMFNFYVHPFTEYLYLPIVYKDIQHLTGAVPREAFARITCLITVYITAERCLCIAFPLHIKQMITPRRTRIVICFIYVFAVIYTPVYWTARFDWKFDLELNKTLIGIVVTGNYEAAQAAVFFIHGISGLLSFVAVVILTAILIKKLQEKSSWRETANAQQDKSESVSQRDKKTMFMVVLIASILIICYTPSVFLAVTTVVEPEFSSAGRFSNLYYIMWSFGLLFETINSSVNIFLYLKMSTKFRHSFLEMFPKCATYSNISELTQTAS